MKDFSKKACYVALVFIIVLIGVGSVDLRPMPEKVLNKYLILVQNKDIENAYHMLHFKDRNSKIDLEEFRTRVDDDPLSEYIIKGSSKINKKTYDVSTYVNLNGWEIEHTFELTKMDGHWKVVYGE